MTSVYSEKQAGHLSSFGSPEEEIQTLLVSDTPPTELHAEPEHLRLKSDQELRGTFKF